MHITAFTQPGECRWTKTGNEQLSGFLNRITATVEAPASIQIRIDIDEHDTINAIIGLETDLDVDLFQRYRQIELSIVLPKLPDQPLPGVKTALAHTMRHIKDQFEEIHYDRMSMTASREASKADPGPR